jgi:hypothetical protein
MADITGGETFVDGQAFNAARANNHVNGAVIQPAFISAKASITPVGGDWVLVLQDSSSLLKKSTITSLPVVTSVALTMPSGFTVSGSPITSNGTLAVTLSDQTTNKHLASPADGSSGAPTFRTRDPRDSRFVAVNIAAQDVDWNLGNVFWKNITTPTGFTFSNTADGAEIMVRISHAGNAATWPAGIFWENGTPPSPTTGITLFRFLKIVGTIYGWVEASNMS